MYKNYVKKIVNEVYKSDNIIVEIPNNKKMGDYSVPCFNLKTEAEKNPVEIAKTIADKIIDVKKIFTKINVAGPYINFYLDEKKLSSKLIDIISIKNYGSSEQGKNKSLLIEHTSTNPNALPHMGRCRNSLIGDFIYNLYKFVGYDVERHYFINDLGKKIALLVIGIDKYGLKTDTFQEILDIYVKISNEAKENDEINELAFKYLERVEAGDKEIVSKFKNITDKCVSVQLKIFNSLDIDFDVFTHESDYVYNNYLHNILEELDKSGKLKKDKDGRYYVDLSDYNIATKEPVLVLTRSNGTSLYPIKDIAYTIHKLSLNEENNLIVLGEDQEVYMQQITAVLDIIGYKAPKLISYSYVLLNGDKMSTCNGTLVLVTDFINVLSEKIRAEFESRNLEYTDETINILTNACIKYTMLNVSRKKIVNFNYETATNFVGESAIYILYSIVRINSILRENPYKIVDIELTLDIEYSLVKKLLEFPNIVDDLINNKESVILTKYLFNLTKDFSTYYEAINISKISDEKIKYSKLILLEAIKNVLTNGLSILGIKTIDKM